MHLLAFVRPRLDEPRQRWRPVSMGMRAFNQKRAAPVHARNRLINKSVSSRVNAPDDNSDDKSSRMIQGGLSD